MRDSNNYEPNAGEIFSPEQVIHAQDKTPQEAESLLVVMEQQETMDNPMARELRTALRQRGAVLTRLNDIYTHVPEAWRRRQLIGRLTDIRRSPGGGGGGSVWGSGLSTEEIEWQVKMAEKYGTGAKIPENEGKAREAARAGGQNTPVCCGGCAARCLPNRLETLVTLPIPRREL